MVKEYKSSASVEDFDLSLMDTNQNMNFIVSQIDSIQRLTKSTGTKQIKKNKPAFNRVILKNVDG